MLVWIFEMDCFPLLGWFHQHYGYQSLICWFAFFIIPLYVCTQAWGGLKRDGQCLDWKQSIPHLPQYREMGIWPTWPNPTNSTTISIPFQDLSTDCAGDSGLVVNVSPESLFNFQVFFLEDGSDVLTQSEELPQHVYGKGAVHTVCWATFHQWGQCTRQPSIDTWRSDSPAVLSPSWDA